MARFRPAGSKKPKPSDIKGLLSCGFLLLLGFGLVFFLLYSVLTSSSK